jgi:hypothetical protein
MRLRYVGVLAGLAPMVVLAGCGKQAASERVAVKPSAGASAQRRPGLWEQTTSVDGRAQTVRLCVDPAMAPAFALTLTAGAKSCKPATLSGAAHGFRFDSDCDLGAGGHQVAHGVVSGDLASSYRMEVTTTVTGAAAPLANGARTSVMTAVWKGPCPAGLAPGQVELPDGTRIKP